MLLLPVGSGVVVWVCVSVLFVWWGVLCPLPPRRGGGWGHCGRVGGVRMVGGMVSEGRALLHCPSRLCVGVPLMFVWWPR